MEPSAPLGRFGRVLERLFGLKVDFGMDLGSIWDSIWDLLEALERC